MWHRLCEIDGMSTNPIISRYFQCHSKRTERNLARIAICTVGLIGLLLTACNTTRGFGQDVQKLGNEIEEEVR